MKKKRKEMSAKEELFKALGKNFSGNTNFALKLPPHVTLELQGEVIEYISKKELKMRFPVQEKHTNPLGNLQGGILSAMFDDVFGPLTYVSAGKPVLTLSLQITFIRGISPGDTIDIHAEVLSRGLTAMFLSAKAFNQNGKLVATAESQNQILNLPKKNAD